MNLSYLAICAFLLAFIAVLLGVLENAPDWTLPLTLIGGSVTCAVLSLRE